MLCRREKGIAQNSEISDSKLATTFRLKEQQKKDFSSYEVIPHNWKSTQYNVS